MATTITVHNNNHDDGDDDDVANNTNGGNDNMYLSYALIVDVSVSHLLRNLRLCRLHNMNCADFIDTH